MKRLPRLLAAAFVLVAAGAAAQDRPYDPKALARYDASYTRCEATFPDMKGHRDEAYLSLWRARPNEKTTARLAGARSSPTYKAEQKEVLRGAAAKASAPEAVKTLERECRALRGEMARMPSAAK
jgi:hypothetical protein